MKKIFNFLNELFRWRRSLAWEEEKNIVTLIRQIEGRTTGQVHVHLDSREVNAAEKNDQNTDFVSVAGEYFTKVGLHQTKYRNGILVYVWLKARKLAIYGDVSAYEKLPREFWQSTVEKSCDIVAQQGLYAGLANCLKQIDVALSQHFPKLSEPVTNEWPDGVSKS